MQIRPEDDAGSALRPTNSTGRGRRFPSMKRVLLISFLALAVLLLALGAWTVQGARWALTGSRHPRRRLAPA